MYAPSCPPARVAVAGQVDRHERTTERERDGVPGVRVLGAAVDEHDLRLVGAPAQRTDVTGGVRVGSAGLDEHLDPFDGRHLGDVEVELGDVLVEQPELVVVVRLVAGRIRRQSFGMSVVMVVIPLGSWSSASRRRWSVAPALRWWSRSSARPWWRSAPSSSERLWSLWSSYSWSRSSSSRNRGRSS